MFAVRVISGVILVVMAVYTSFVVMAHGLNFIPDYIGNIVAMNWPGQFQMDFSGYLLISALWVGWRHKFSGAGLALALGALCGGMLFFAAYLLVISLKEKGDVAALVLGNQRAQVAA
ncbi:MAG: hypothetical protein AB8G16_01420 [Gammaproteobacteria bacterium]